MSRLNPVLPENYPYYQTIARNIRYYRQKKKKTQSELADMIHCSDKSISRIENDISVNPCSLETLFSIARALEVEPYKLLKPLDE